MSTIAASMAYCYEPTYNQNNNNHYDYHSYNSSYSAIPQQYYQGQYSQPFQGRVVVVPAGAQIPATVNFSLSSETVTENQTVSFVLPQAFYYDNVLIAPAGSTVYGVVTLAKKAGHAGRNAELKILFNNIVTPEGKQIQISGCIYTEDGSGVLRSGDVATTTLNYVKNATIGAATGAIMGVIMGPLSDGSVGQGAIYGTAIGGGLGVGKALWDKGKEVEIKAGDRVNIILNMPVTVNVGN